MYFDYIRTATTLVAYFARQEAEGGDGWAAGRQAALAWLALLNDPASADERSIAHVDRLVDAGEHEMGTAWDELRIAYRHWRRTGR